MDQFTRCDYNNYLAQLDQFCSKISQFSGSISNLATQVVTGWNDEDTPVYLTINNLKTAYDDADWSELGQLI